MEQGKKIFSVLVVDDEEPIRKLIYKVIRRIDPDADIVSVDSGDAAVINMTEKEEPYDLVITDVEMPLGMFDGIDVLCQAKEISKQTIVFVCSGNPESRNAALREKVFEQSRDVYLGKPFLISELINFIKEAFPLNFSA